MINVKFYSKDWCYQKKKAVFSSLFKDAIEEFKKCRDQVLSYTLSESDYNKTILFAEKVAEAKSIEYKKDKAKLYERFSCGFVCESAAEKVLGVKIRDWTIGLAKQYDNPDIRGYHVGIKSSRMFNFPLVKLDAKYPEIICIQSIKNPRKVYILGLATVDDMKKYSSPELIISNKLREKDVKTGFYGFTKLIPIKTKDDISMYKIYS